MNQISWIVYRTLRKTGLRRVDILSGKDFKDELGLDSLEILYLTNQFERNLKINIPDEDIKNFTNLDNTVKYLSEKVYV